MRQKVIQIITLLFFTVVVFMTVCGNGHADQQFYGQMNITGLNAGSLQLKGVTWCKEYFEKCVIRENFMAGTLQSRELVDPDQFVVMQTGIENPQIVSVESDTGGRHRIIFVYDQKRVHKLWVPEYIE